MMATAMSLISSYTVPVGGQSGGVTFSAIPATYDHLYVMISGRGLRSSSPSDDMSVVVNSSSSYTNVRLYAQSPNNTTGTTGADGGTSSSNNYSGVITGDLSTAAEFGMTEFWLPNYKLTSRTKVLHGNGAARPYAIGSQIDFTQITFNVTDAITSITFDVFNTVRTFTSDSTFYLFGISNA